MVWEINCSVWRSGIEAGRHGRKLWRTYRAYCPAIKKNQLLLSWEEWNGSRQVQMKVMENLQNLRSTVRRRRKLVETYRSAYPAIIKISFQKKRMKECPAFRRISFQKRGKQ